MNRLQAAMVSATVAAALGCATQAPAQEHFPTRPIQLIVPTTGGGGTDVAARMLASLAEPILGQQVVVLNKPGAGGAVGIDAMLQAKPDGYTLAGVWNSPITVTPLMFDANYKRSDYVPVELSDVAPTVFCVMKDFPANNGLEFMKVLHDNPNKYTYGTDGVSGTVLMSAELVFSHFDAHARPVPYNGASETLNAFSGHYIDIYGGSTALIAPAVKAGTAKCMWVSTSWRSNVLPDAYSVTDLGDPEGETTLWHAVIAPAKVPKDRLAVLEHAFREAASSQKYKDFAATQGEIIKALDSEDARKLMNREYDQFEGVIKHLGLKTQKK